MAGKEGINGEWMGKEGKEWNGMAGNKRYIFYRTRAVLRKKLAPNGQNGHLGVPFYMEHHSANYFSSIEK